MYTVQLPMAMERPQMEWAGRWHPTPSSHTAKPAVANARSLWGKLCYEHLISSSFKFPWFSEWLLSQVTWDKEWLSPRTYQMEVQRVPINQCCRKASFKVCLLVSWEREQSSGFVLSCSLLLKRRQNAASSSLREREIGSVLICKC